MNSIHKRYKILILAMTLLPSFIFLSCKKLVDVDAPITSTNAENVFSTDQTAASVLTGIYTDLSLSSFPDGGITSSSLFLGMAADELTLYPGSTNMSYVAYYTNELTKDNTLGTDFWIKFYETIFVANSAIEGLNNSSKLSPSVKQQLLGEAKFIRAFCYFYLVNLYGDVPLTLTSDYKVNASLARTPGPQVYEQIINDLKEARQLLSDTYLDAILLNSTEERVRPTKWAATALLARTYLFMGDWANAELEASAIINNTALFDLTALNNTYLKNSAESIWQLQPVMADVNTQDAVMFVLPDTGPTNIGNEHPVSLSNNIISSFENGDQRMVDWVDSVTVNGSTYYYPYKYKVNLFGEPLTEYTMVLRLAEQYLIRAEASAQQNKITEAQNDLNTIRNRAGLADTAENDKDNLLAAILHERQVELFTEWGHRWLDIKRTSNVDAVMNNVTPQKGGNWQTTDQLFPITQTELSAALQLSQNPGYN